MLVILFFPAEIHGKKIAATIDGNNDIIEHITLNGLQGTCFQAQLFSFLLGFVLLIDAFSQ